MYWIHTKYIKVYFHHYECLRIWWIWPQNKSELVVNLVLIVIGNRMRWKWKAAYARQSHSILLTFRTCAGRDAFKDLMVQHSALTFISDKVKAHIHLVGNGALLLYMKDSVASGTFRSISCLKPKEAVSCVFSTRSFKLARVITFCTLVLIWFHSGGGKDHLSYNV